MFEGQVQSPEKDTIQRHQCDTCLNNSMLVDVLVLAGVKHLYHRITENIMLSYCPLHSKYKEHGKLNESADTSNNVIIGYKCDCIYHDCAHCGVIYFQ